MPDRDSFAQERASADHTSSFFGKLRLDWLLLHFPPRLVRSAYVFVNGFITIGLLALLALVSRSPFVFPSLGPTAYLLFFTPLGRTSSPRNTLLGTMFGVGFGPLSPSIGIGPEIWNEQPPIGGTSPGGGLNTGDVFGSGDTGPFVNNILRPDATVNSEPFRFYTEAIGFLMSDPRMAAIILQLQLSRRTYVVRFNRGGGDNALGGRINWDP